MLNFRTIVLFFIWSSKLLSLIKKMRRITGIVQNQEVWRSVCDLDNVAIISYHTHVSCLHGTEMKWVSRSIKMQTFLNCTASAYKLPWTHITPVVSGELLYTYEKLWRKKSQVANRIADAFMGFCVIHHECAVFLNLTDV